MNRWNQWDYGFREQPMATRADFGGRGNSFGIGAMDQGSYSYNDTGASSPDLKELEIQAAHDMIRKLQYQIDKLSASVTQNETTQSQLNLLKQEMAKYTAVVDEGIMGTLRKNLPYIALGVGGLVFVVMLMQIRRTA